MNKYDRQKELYRELVGQEVCKVIIFKWECNYLSKIYNQLEDRTIRLRKIIKELDGE